MADYEMSIDLSPIIRAVQKVNDNIGIVSDQVEQVNDNLIKVRNETMNEIEKLKIQLETMEKDARFRAALQRALTEIIRVRQELEQNFGTHKLVRDYMLGILQASDLALISKSTISRCTEELMISAPQYWLAPCLIALAAWISDNKTLAERAVKEAIKRDEEKTCLLFALVTRRVNAGRIAAGKKGTSVCFQWLNRYFSLQDPRKMRSSIVAYVDAYSNGVFGYDSENICSEHIRHWMDVLMEENPEFGEEQEKYWNGIFNSKVFPLSGENYEALKLLSPQYNLIENYVSKINASENEGGIKDFINNIQDGVADKDKLIKQIDEQLTYLVTNYEEGKEEELRKEEELLQRIKDLKGDEELAEHQLRQKYAARVDVPVNFADRLNHSILSSDASISEKKTALSLLRPFISKAFNNFITQQKDEYPEVIDLVINDPGKATSDGKPFKWEGSTKNGENAEELTKELGKLYDKEKKEALERVTDDEAKKYLKKGKIALCLFILIIPLFLGISWMRKGKRMLKNNENTRLAIENYYSNNKAKNVSLLEKALEARKEANEIVETFCGDESNESIELKDAENN